MVEGPIHADNEFYVKLLGITKNEDGSVLIRKPHDLFCDVDGCLANSSAITGTEVRILPSVLAALSVFQEFGLKFALVSGRTEEELRKAILPIKEGYALGCTNGLTVHTTDGKEMKTIKLPPLKEEGRIIGELVKQFRHRHGVGAIAFTANEISVEVGSETHLKELKEIFETPYYNLKRVKSGELHVLPLKHGFELQSSKLNKSLALKALKEHDPNFSLKNTFAVGDASNDHPMLEVVNTALFIGTKKQADEAGAGYFLEDIDYHAVALSRAAAALLGASFV